MSSAPCVIVWCGWGVLAERVGESSGKEGCRVPVCTHVQEFSQQLRVGCGALLSVCSCGSCLSTAGLSEVGTTSVCPVSNVYRSLSALMSGESGTGTSPEFRKLDLGWVFPLLRSVESAVPQVLRSGRPEQKHVGTKPEGLRDLGRRNLPLLKTVYRNGLPTQSRENLRKVEVIQT